MRPSVSERKYAENQVAFRSFNESVQEGIDNVNKVAAEEGVAPFNLDGDTPLHFICECSDENCKNRIKISLNNYNKIHEARDTFTITCGHEIKEMEYIIATEEEYCVVKKYKQPPESANGLNPTPRR